MIDDLRHIQRNDDPFQIISEETAGEICFWLVCALALGDILWRFL